MRHIVAFTLVLLASSLASAQTALERQTFAMLKPEVQVLVQAWLNKNCGAAEHQRIETQLRAIGSVLEPVFWEAFRVGPTAQELQEVDGAAAKRFTERQSWLRQFGDVQMGKEETARQLTISDQQYVDREVAQYIERYKTAALAALGLVGTKRSEAALSRIADDNTNFAQISAQEALKSIRQGPDR